MRAYTDNWNHEAFIVDKYLSNFGIRVETIPPADLYSLYLRNKEDIFLCYKKFYNLYAHKKGWGEFVDVFQRDRYNRMYFIERSPYRFKQFIDRKAHNTFCGVLISKVSYFSNHLTQRQFDAYTNSDNKRIKDFRQHWIKQNEYKQKLKYNCPLIYFPLQKVNDKSVTSVGYTHYPADAMVRTVYEVLKVLYKKFMLIVRPHPDYKKYGYDYKPIKDDRVLFTLDIPHVSLIMDSDLIVSFSSSALAESILQYKRVWYFANLPVVNNCGIGYRIPAANPIYKPYIYDLAYILQDYMYSKINVELYNRYLNYVINDISIYDNFHTKKEATAIVKRKFNL